MKSPFPGMNPFIEGYKWPPFHVSMIVYMQEALIDQIPEGFILESETTLYIEEDSFREKRSYRPDISVFNEPRESFTAPSRTATLTPPDQRRKKLTTKLRSLQIFDSERKQLITSIELLSPTNKIGEGLVSYRKKRREMQLAGINIVEIDLLRGGERVDAASDHETTYLVEVIEESNEDILEWHIGLLDPLPTVPVPLSAGIPPLALDLQYVFQKTFKHSTLPRALSYAPSDLLPPLENDAEREKLMVYLAQQTNDGRA